MILATLTLCNIQSNDQHDAVCVFVCLDRTPAPWWACFVFISKQVWHCLLESAIPAFCLFSECGSRGAFVPVFSVGHWVSIWFASCSSGWL